MGTEIDGTAQGDIDTATWSTTVQGQYVVTGDATGIHKAALITHLHPYGTIGVSVPFHYHNTFSLTGA